MVEDFIEIELKNDEAFLLVKETLSRIGIASKRNNVLYPSCHILHKRGKFYVVHFKEMFRLDGRDAPMTDEDVARRNTIARLLHSWGLCKIVGMEGSHIPEKVADTLPISRIKILSFEEKRNWTIEPKYNIGKKRGV